MTMHENDIWRQIDFSDKQDSAYDLLIRQSENLTKATKGELKMQVDAMDAYIDGDPPRPAALYILYVAAPKLGNFRRKILTVSEHSDIGRFPVDIVCHLDKSPKIENVSKDKFISTVEEILARPAVKATIQNLFKLSKNRPE